MSWEKTSEKEIKQEVFAAIDNNLNYAEELLFGVPATFLDQDEFYTDAPFLKDAPYLTAMIKNPNHIGCHTLGDSEPFFKGTHELEKEVIAICAENILKAEKGSIDGYVASGGTEGNIEALWIYRNYFVEEKGANIDEIAFLFSEDTHYSLPKGCNLLNVKGYALPVDSKSRQIDTTQLRAILTKAVAAGKKYFVFNANMGTTMFGSVDKITPITSILKEFKVDYKIHVDAAFGGFIYPFTNQNSELDFSNPEITSVSLDAHKMLQTPYGTGIFLIRKGYIEHAVTKEAQYVKGQDYTIVGSRSGANAVVIYMILKRHGYSGWKHKVENLIDRTQRITTTFDELGIKYFNNPFINIITIEADSISTELAKKYRLVANSHDGKVQWWKIVIMPHIKKGQIDQFLIDVAAEH